MIEKAIYDLLKGMVGGRVYPDVAPLNAPMPYITYQQVGGRSVTYLGRDLPGTLHAHMQVNVWGPDRLAVAGLARNIQDAFILTPSITTEPLGAPVSVYEEDTKLYGSRQEFSCWYDR